MAQQNQQHVPEPMAVILEQIRQEMARNNQQMQDQQHQLDALGQQIQQHQPQPALQPMQPMQPVQPVAPHLGHVVNIKPDQLPPFHGKRSESLEAWIFQMQQYCNLLPVPVENCIPFAATFFKDNAALWWRSYYMSIDWNGADLPNWDGFLEALRLQFVPVNTQIGAYDHLHHLTQCTSVNQYNHDFCTIMLDLPNLDEATHLNFYIQGLKDNIHPLVAIQQPANVATAEAIAECVDAMTFQPRNRNPGNHPFQSS